MPEEGTNIGNAYATISLVLKGVQQARQQLERDAKAAGEAIDGIGSKTKATEQKVTGAFANIAKGADAARAKIKALNESPLGKLQKGLEDLKNRIMGVSAVAGGLAVVGTSLARTQKQIETTYKALLGGSKQAESAINDIRKTADELHSPFLPMLEGGKALIQLSKVTGKDLGELVVMAERLRILNPEASIQDAAFAMKELLLGGDALSLRERFNVDTRDLKAAFGNDKEALYAGLDKKLSTEFNATKEAVIEINKADPFPRLASSMKEALAVGFKPLLEALIPIVEAAAQFFDQLNKTNPQLLAAGAGIAVIVAAAYPLMTVLTSVIGLWKGIAAAAALAGKSMSTAGAVKLGVTGAALGAGALIGQKIATGLADQGIGDQRLRSDSGENFWDVIGERLKQGFAAFILKPLADLAKNIAIFIDFWGKAFSEPQKIADMVSNYIKIAMLQFQSDLIGLFMELETALHNAFPQLFPESQKGLGKRNDDGTYTDFGAKSSAGYAKDRIDAQIADLNSQNMGIGNTIQSDADRQKINDDIDQQLMGMFEMLGLIPGKVKEVSKEIEEAVDEIPTKPLGDTPEYLAQQAEEIAAAVQQYNEDITSLDTERLQALSEANQKFADDQVKIAQEAASVSAAALAQLIEDRDRLNTDFVRDGEKAERERGRKIRDEQIKAARKEVEDTQQHADKIAGMRDKQRKDEADALMDLDFKKLFELTSDNASTLAGENTDFAKQREARNLALQYELEDMQRSFQDERDERLVKFNQDLSDRSVQYHKEKEQLAQQAVEKQAQLQAAYTTELQQIQNKYLTERQIREQAIQQELSFLMQTEAQRAKILANTQQQLLAQAAALAQKFGGMRIAQPAAQAQSSQMLQNAAGAIRNSPVGNVLNNLGNVAGNIAGSVGNTLNNLFNNLPGRAGGGPLAAGQSAAVNEPGSSGMEWWLSGDRAVALPGAGIFTPVKSGRVDANRGARAGSSQPIQFILQLNAPMDSGILTLDEALMLIDSKGREIVLEAVGQLNGN